MARLKFCFHESVGGVGYPSRNLRELNEHGIAFGAKATDKMPYDAQQIAREYPNIENMVIYRKATGAAPSGWADVPEYRLSPEDAAVRHWDWHRENLPPELDKAITWIETINEVAQHFEFDKEEDAQAFPAYGLRSVYQRPNGKWVVTNGEWMARFAQATAVLMLNQGYKWLAFGWAPGEPEPEVWAGPEMRNFLEMCADYPDNLGIALHEYSLSVDDISNGDGYLIGRFRFLFDICDSYNINRPTVAITEWGWTHNSVPGWIKAQHDYLEVGKLYADYPEVKTAAIWALNPGWGGIAEQAKQHIEPLHQMTLSIEFPDDPHPVPPDPPQPDTCEWEIDVGRTAHLIPQDTTLAELESVTRLFHPARNSFVHSHDDAGLIASHGNADRSKVIVWNPERWGFDILAWYEERGVKTAVSYFEGSQPAPGVIDAPIFWQRDPRWANHLCGFGPKTIGQWGCLLCVYNSLAEMWGINEGRNPDEESDYYKSRGGFYGDNLVSMAFSRVYANVKDEGWIAGGPGMHQKTRSYLSRGIPVPARVDFRPTTEAPDQHWILLVGYDEDTNDYLMNDPWTGKTAVSVAETYGIAGDDVLECIYYYYEAVSPPIVPNVDQTRYYTPENGSYGVITIKGTTWGGDVRQQIQRHGDELFVTKGNEIEVRKIDRDAGVIRFLMDDSPGNGKYYTVQSAEGWLPSMAYVGQRFTRRERVDWFWKENCQPTGEWSNWTNEMVLAAVHDRWVSPLNPAIVYRDVSEWHWVVDGVIEEKYFLAPHRGYAGWWNRHGRSSYVKEEIPVGHQGNNVFPGACYHGPVGVEYP